MSASEISIWALRAAYDKKIDEGLDYTAAVTAVIEENVPDADRNRRATQLIALLVAEDNAPKERKVPCEQLSLALRRPRKKASKSSPVLRVDDPNFVDRHESQLPVGDRR